MRHIASLLFLFFGIILVINRSLVTCLPVKNEREQVCGYGACLKSNPNKLNIHLVAHSHDDVGWLKTVDQYYHGQSNHIQRACVQCIIDSVIEELLKDRNRKFIYVETAFLWQWWNHQSEDKKQITRDLINEGRFEIIGGGWSMNDEAVTHYQSIIDQFTWGFRRLNDTFGPCSRPKIGWQIDPFGHSREQASIFAQMGFDGLFFARLDYEDKAKRIKDKTTEFIWNGSPSLGESSNLFISVLYNHYGPPTGFCFDVLCSYSSINDDKNSSEYNVDWRAEQLLRFAETQADAYRTNNILITMGNDFTYEKAEPWFTNLDKLIKYINNETPNYNIFYSTPSCYLKSVHELNLTYSVKSDDFFPYGSDSSSYWTGYYTSRPTLKFAERMGNRFLQVVKQLSVLTNEPDSEKLQLFREQMGVMQHHDAITGTEKQHVAEDYLKFLHTSMEDGEQLASKILKKWALKKETVEELNFHSCLQLNVSSCQYSSESEKFAVTVYNPTSQPLTTYVRVPVLESSYSVQDFRGEEVISQLVPIPKQVQNIQGRTSNATQELVFRAENIPPLNYYSFYINKNTNASNFFEKSHSAEANTSTLSNGMYNVSINVDGEIVFESVKAEGLRFNQSFHYYEGYIGRPRSSGAYVFKPAQSHPKYLTATSKSQIFRGPLVQEIHQTINEWISQVIRIYDYKNYIEFDWLVGPIPTSDTIGKEVITKFSSNLNTNEEFYTDSNGREMLKRKLNYRPTWNLTLTELIAANYYPVTTKISIQDQSNKLRLSVLTDRAQGGSSLKNGEVELMVHRRLLVDDGFGVGEALDEKAFDAGLVVRGQHYVAGGSSMNLDELILNEKKLAVELALRPWIFITPFQLTFEEWNESYKMKGDNLIGRLPTNVHILTLEPWKNGEILLRLEHLFEKRETITYSSSVRVDLKELFSGFSIHTVQEVTLGGNQNSEEMQRLKWFTETNEVPTLDSITTDESTMSEDLTIVQLKPMEIRTFIIKLSHKIN